MVRPLGRRRRVVVAGIVAGPVLAFLSIYQFSAARDRVNVVQSLQARGFYIQRDYTNPICRLPLMGRFAPIEFIDSQGAAIDTDITLIARLGSLKRLSLDNSSVTDVGVSQLADLGHLESINLSRTRVSDRGLAALRSLPNLKTMSLTRTNVTDAGLGHLAAMPSLESVELGFTAVTDSGVEKFRPFCTHFVKVHR